MKFGGTSVRDDKSRFAAMKHIKRNVDDGKKVVVVVSAMGRKGEPYATDTLINLMKNIDGNVSICPQELDLVMSCGEIISASYFSHFINQHYLPGIAFTGYQAGILTDDNAGEAKIKSINPERILKELDKGKIPVIAGFQGANSVGDIRTLGRGGSDTSAVALSSALNAEKVEIYSDVDGVAYADPRQVENVKYLKSVSVKQILLMADEGSKVIHPRALNASIPTQTPIVVRNTFNDFVGTNINHGEEIHNNVTIAHCNSLAIAEFEECTNVSGISGIKNIDDKQYLLTNDVYLDTKLSKLKKINKYVKLRLNYATVSVVFSKSISEMYEVSNAKIIFSNNHIIRYLVKSEYLTNTINQLYNYYIKHEEWK
jgi:aspartate kinase